MRGIDTVLTTTILERISLASWEKIPILMERALQAPVVRWELSDLCVCNKNTEKHWHILGWDE